MYAIVFGMCVGLVECASCAMYLGLRKKAFSYQEVAEERAAQAEVDVVKGAGDVRDARAAQGEVIHPFLGFVVKDVGYCDRPFKLPRSRDDRVVVMIVGGSVAYNLHEDGGAHLQALLAKAPEFSGKEIKVINGALWAAKQPQQLMCLAYILAHRRRVDVLVNLDGLNEIVGDVVTGADKRGIYPAFPIDWASRVAGVGDRGAIVRVAQVIRHREDRRAWARRMSGFPMDQSITAGFIWTALDRVEAARISAAVQVLQGEETSGADSYRVTGPALRTIDTAEKRYRWKAGFWRQSSIQLHRLAEASGVRYFHFLQPSQYLAGTKPFTDQERERAIAEGGMHDRAVNAGYPALLAEVNRLTAEGVRFTDLTRLYEQVPETLYVDDCCHVNERGSRMMAERIARAIIEDADATPR
jgi:hypothetical protein